MPTFLVTPLVFIVTGVYSHCNISNASIMNLQHPLLVNLSLAFALLKIWLT